MLFNAQSYGSQVARGFQLCYKSAKQTSLHGDNHAREVQNEQALGCFVNSLLGLTLDLLNGPQWAYKKSFWARAFARSKSKNRKIKFNK